MADSPHRFRIAFSFVGEKRHFVEKVAALVAAKFGEDRILYDKYHEAEFAVYNNLPRFQPFFGREKELTVVREALDPESRTRGALIDAPAPLH